MECVTCVCVTRDGVGGFGGERIGFELYQSWRNRGEWGLCFGCGGVGEEWGGAAWAMVWEGAVVLVCLCCESGFFVLMAGPGIQRIPAHLRCTQCSILMHLIDLGFLTCICRWQISQIQTCLREVVRPGLVSTSLAFMRGIASHPAGPHDRLAQKR